MPRCAFAGYFSSEAPAASSALALQITKPDSPLRPALTTAENGYLAFLSNPDCLLAYYCQSPEPFPH